MIDENKGNFQIKVHCVTVNISRIVIIFIFQQYSTIMVNYVNIHHCTVTPICTYPL